MADVRCPMCGKLNPADAEVCRYCQARLKPLAGPAGQPPAANQPPAENQPPDEDSSDWLRGLLGSSSPAEEPREPAAPGEELESADWLERIRQRSREEQDALSKIGTPPEIHETPASSEEPADWLRGLTHDPSVSAANADDVSAWLDSLRDKEEPPTAPDAPTLPTRVQPAPSAEGLSDEDWLHNLTASGFSDQFGEAGTPNSTEPAAPANEPAEEPAAAPADIPDWLRDSEQTPPAAEASAAEETPDWLSSFSNATPAAASSEPAAPAEEIPDWLRSLEAPAEPDQPEPAVPAAPAEDMPGWLQSLQPSAEPGAPEEPPAEPAAAEDMPGWLQSLQSSQQPSEPEEAPQIPSPAEDLPDWLQSLQSSNEAEPPAASTENAPSWMSGPAAPAFPPETAPLSDLDLSFEQGPAPVEPAQGQDSFTPAQEPPVEPEAPAYQEEDIPSWLREFQSSAPAQPAAPVEEPPTPFSIPPQVDSPVSPFSSESLPDWMSAESLTPEGSVKPFIEDETPAETQPPFASADINELLAGVASDQSASGEKASGAEPESLAPAQLPNWLQAMRPIESAMVNAPSPSAEDEQLLEKSGPLAGLRGVLPVEELVSQYKKPPVYTNKLHLSDKQRLHTSLLETILADEAKSQPVPGEPTQAHQTILRVLVAAVLILLIIVPPLAGFKMPLPANLSASQPAAAAAYNSLNSLPAGSTVLVVSDFEAGRSGEMKAAAGPVLRHMQSRQPKIVLASTIAEGPVLGEMLLKESGSTPLVNLGYIAGGSSALKLLGTRASSEIPAPLQLAVPFPYDRDWSDPVLQSMRDLSSFQRIVLLTDSVETARGWIEQVQPNLPNNTELLIVSSAQAAPLVRAYVESGQARGLVSGLPGGLAYEQLARQNGATAASWTAYQLTLATVILLIFAGGLIAGISALFRLSQTKRKA